MSSRAELSLVKRMWLPVLVIVAALVVMAVATVSRTVRLIDESKVQQAAQIDRLEGALLWRDLAARHALLTQMGASQASGWTEVHQKLQDMPKTLAPALHTEADRAQVQALNAPQQAYMSAAESLAKGADPSAWSSQGAGPSTSLM